MTELGRYRRLFTNEPLRDRVKHMLGKAELEMADGSLYRFLHQKLSEKKSLVNKAYDGKIMSKIRFASFEPEEGHPLVATLVGRNTCIRVQDAIHFTNWPGLRTNETIFLYPDGSGTKKTITDPGKDTERMDMHPMEPGEIAELYEKFKGASMVHFRPAL